MSRDDELRIIARSNKAAAVGRLMLGQIREWDEFIKVESEISSHLNRRILKGAVKDVKTRLNSELDRFCQKNFIGMTLENLEKLYNDIKASFGIECALLKFENDYARIRRDVLSHSPEHLTVSNISWGLQYKFPEDEISKDIAVNLKTLKKVKDELKKYVGTFTQIHEKRDEISELIQIKNQASRSIVFSSFNLIEAYLNGIAWDHVNKSEISNTKKALLSDKHTVSFEKKLKEYPSIISGHDKWFEDSSNVKGLLDIVKPFRDAMVHPSPFTAPERFGGYDKLRLFYRIDDDTADMAIHLVISIINEINNHCNDGKELSWLKRLSEKITA